MPTARTSDLWWKNSVFYCADVETFQDSDGDGCGDFAGLMQRLDHLDRLGVNCLWLMPFQPTSNRDDGYDVTDYYAVDPRFGSLGDFVELMRAAKDRGIRVIADLVVNHTSKEHPWFQASRSDPSSPYRDWYVWQETKPPEKPGDLVFPDEEDSNWEWDDKAKAFYLHRFYKHQPDLNVTNAAVREEIRKITGFWLELGLSGFRVDAVPFLLETEHVAGKVELDPHGWLRDLRAFIGRRRGDAILMGEVNLEPEQVRQFFGDEDGDELHMSLNFNLNQTLALALVRADAGLLAHGLKALPSLPEEASWANFIRNHDEWSLDKLTEAERAEAFKAFGPKAEMQLFGRGLRRRLPTMFDGDQARLRMAYSLMMALPGAPVLFYGEEIGMAENLAIPGRMSVRSPMQWNASENGGFSTAPANSLCRPLVTGRRWGPTAVNVAGQERDQDSLLTWMERLVRRRRAAPEIAFGSWTVLPLAQASVLALRYDWHDRTVVTIHNLGGEACCVTLRLEPPTGASWARLSDLAGRKDLEVRGDGTVEIEVAAYDHRWLRAERTGA